MSKSHRVQYMKFRSQILKNHTKLLLSFFSIIMIGGSLFWGNYSHVLPKDNITSDSQMPQLDSKDLKGPIMEECSPLESIPFSVPPIATPLDESESWTNQLLGVGGWVAAYWTPATGADYKYEWSFSTSSNPRNIRPMAVNSSQFTELQAGRTYWYFPLRSNPVYATSDSGTWYPGYSDVWYIVYLNVDLYSTYLTAQVTKIWLGEITITSPTSSDTLLPGNNHNIQWTNSHSSPSDPNPLVKIELYKRQSTLPPTWASEFAIAASTANDGVYTWTIPTSIGPLGARESGYGIKISSINEPAKVYDFSAVFQIAAIGITNPTSSSLWAQNSTYDITWASTAAGSTVSIELYKASSLETTIAASTDNNGTYSWAVPDSLTPASDYQIKVTSITYSSVYNYSNSFQIIPPTSLTITNPTGSASWNLGSSYNITWESIGSIPTVDIWLGNGSSNWIGWIVLDAPNNGSFEWQVTSWLIPGTNYWIYIGYDLTGDDNDDIWDYSDYFEIAPSLYSIAITSPTSESKWTIGDIYTISWTTTGNISWVDIALYNGSSNLLFTIAAPTENDGSYDWTVPALTPGSNYWIALQYDSDGDGSYDVVAYGDDFEVAAPDGSITVTSPTSSSTWITGSSVTITWSSTGTISTVDIALCKADTVLEVITAATVNDGSYTWTVTASLTPGSDYWIFIGYDYDADDNYDFTAGSDDFTIAAPEIATTTDGAADTSSERDEPNLIEDAVGFETPFLMLVMIMSFLLLVRLKRKRTYKP
jgi:hypothetical protein